MTSALTLITHKLQLHKPLLNSEKHLKLKEQTHLWYTLLTFEFYDYVFLADKAKFPVFYFLLQTCLLILIFGIVLLIVIILVLVWSFNLKHETKTYSRKLYKLHIQEISIVQILYTPSFFPCNRIEPQLLIVWILDVVIHLTISDMYDVFTQK